jgi:hypothetical protein
LEINDPSFSQVEDPSWLLATAVVPLQFPSLVLIADATKGSNILL